MSTFTYTARDTTSNKQIKATIQADSERGAAKLLIAQGFVPLKIVENSKSGGLLGGITERITAKDRVIFTRQLSTLIGAGLPLAQSLHTVVEQTQNKRFRVIIQEIITSVEGGRSLADSFAKFPKVFNNVFIALLSAGEASGTLDKALERIASQQEKDAELLSKVRGAMVYPAIVLLAIMGVIVFMMTTVMPQIQQLYHDLKATLPFITQVMVGMSDFSAHFWWLVILIIVALVYFIRRYIATESGRRLVDGSKLHIPLFGVMFQKLYMARFARTGETLMSSGVPMLEMLRIASQSVNNVVISKSIDRAAEKVKGGKALSLALKDDPNILTLVPQMISIGEQSGGIDKMMGKAATFYENELDNTVRSISTAIEPILMMVLAVVAGGLVAAILLPVYSLVGSGAIH